LKATTIARFIILRFQLRLGRLVVNIRRWATKNLRPGDLTALSNISRGQWTDPEAERLDRLNQRGFVTKKAGSTVVTILGRAALLIRKFTKH
jgi:hypothetical protein